MTQLMNRFRSMTASSRLVKDERGLSTVEYVIILVLIAAAAVGLWINLGTTLKAKLGDANSEIGKISVDGSSSNSNSANKSTN